ncbi:cutinase [Segniliparus rotundus DSM 44985]|uniref:cutinase n=1 Tax=Segniliparus rotundus (strain ATCC BAA-972 / CDC 1076 / CIP 108378 / DSM 44985 / JCM 13578) TaxID=640132 RepID=D6ZA91_SEGRD|nr:cutinase family protein [Segniliparus rotundus]ADG96633.1 cutinase [Segniliparus rotundus DSM 44985]
MMISSRVRGVLSGLLPLLSLSAASLPAVATMAPNAAAAPAGCADYDISFARGTGEPAGVGVVGNAFANALKAKEPGKTFNVHGVDYAADYDFVALDLHSLAAGADNLSAHLQDVASRCPDTQFVLGGYSQGAALVDAVISFGVPLLGFSNPLPGDVANRIVGVALFGDATHRVFNGLQPVFITPDLAAKTTNICADGDPICENVEGGLDTQSADFNANHTSYVSRGLTAQGAAFVADQINGQPAQAAPAPQPPAENDAQTAPDEDTTAAPEEEGSDADGE